ncbi:hypothetical protein [Ferrimicrobium sp.]|uniref:hypothetical protein n=1 Tax=Ferrimicrobium sp. TaxID=2926050 RepID=UPI00260E5882|nr:hypothetical protein [Ferrimicrobium sp.]
MPNYIAGPAMDFQAQIARLERMVKALASQQNLVISNNQRQKVLTLGTAASLPGSSYSAPDSSYAPTFAMQLLNPNGTPMMQVGEQFDTSYSPGMVFFSANGDPLTILDDAGLTVKDSGGNTRVQVGELSNGDYGLQVTDTAGTTLTVNPPYGYTSGTDSSLAEATSWSSFGFPTQSVPIGPSGIALMMVSASMAAISSSWIDLGVSINGANPGYYSLTQHADVLQSLGYAYFVNGLPTGTIDFGLMYMTGGVAGTYSVESPALVIWPL